jgi:hypothetical protein
MLATNNMNRILLIFRAGAHAVVLACLAFVANKVPALGWVFLPVLLIGLPAMLWAERRKMRRPTAINPLLVMAQPRVEPWHFSTLMADPMWVYPFCGISAVLGLTLSLFGGLQTAWPTPLPTEVNPAATDLRQGIIFKHTHYGRKSASPQIGLSMSPEQSAMYFSCEEFAGFCESWQGTQRRGAIRTTLDPRGFLIPIEVLDEHAQVLVSQPDQIRHINGKRRDQQAMAWGGSALLAACALLVMLTALPKLFKGTR